MELNYLFHRVYPFLHQHTDAQTYEVRLTIAAQSFFKLSLPHITEQNTYEIELHTQKIQTPICPDMSRNQLILLCEVCSKNSFCKMIRHMIHKWILAPLHLSHPLLRTKLTKGTLPYLEHD